MKTEVLDIIRETISNLHKMIDKHNFKEVIKNKTAEIPLDCAYISFGALCGIVEDTANEYNVKADDIEIIADEDELLYLTFLHDYIPGDDEIYERKVKMFSNNFSMELAKVVKLTDTYRVKMKRSSRDCKPFPKPDDHDDVYEAYFNYFIEEVTND